MRTLSILFLLVFLAACGMPEAAPKDLAGKKKLLKEKKTALKALTAEIDQLKEEIVELDTSKVVKSRRLVIIGKTERRDFNRFVEIQAAVESGDAVMASSETGGRIIQLNVDEGKPVRKGQLIAKLDMESIDKQIAEVETTKILAEQVYTRQAKLWSQNIGSEIQYLQAKNNKERLEKSLESLRFQLTKANVYAPISGVVDKVYAESGEMAGPGTPIVEIINTRQVKVVANVPERYLPIMKRGQLVDVKFPAINEERKAKISMIGNSINPANRTFEAEVELSNPKGVLKPNLLSLMVVNDFSAKDVVVIPLDLVQQEVSGKNYVFIRAEGPDGSMAKKVYVETGESVEGDIIITEGLKGEEEIILDGARGLAENELIEVKVAEPTASN